MRRAVVAVIVSGVTLGGIGSGLGHQPVVFGASLTTNARPVLISASLTAITRPVKKTVINPVRKKKVKQKTVSYEGVEFSVPASWPVYWLDEDPDQCVRYDRNAVYVGNPGPDQNCPPDLVGRADTISIGGPAVPAETGQLAGSTAPAETGQQATVGGKQAR